jgi:hypothetical protein
MLVAGSIGFVALGPAAMPEIHAAVPVLVDTTTPARVDMPAQGNMPAQVNMPIQANATVSAAPADVRSPNHNDGDFRGLLDPDAVVSTARANQRLPGSLKINRFVELHSDLPFESERREAKRRAAAAVAGSEAMAWQGAPGRIRKNPLVTDDLPRLRRFAAGEDAKKFPLWGAASEVRGLQVALQHAPRPRSEEEIDQAIEALEPEPRQSISPRTVARGDGFGVLAIDRIGSRDAADEGTLGEQLAAATNDEQQDPSSESLPPPHVIVQKFVDDIVNKKRQGSEGEEEPATVNRVRTGGVLGHLLKKRR